MEKKEDLISRQAAIDALRTMQTYKLCAGDELILIDKAEAQTELMMLPSAHIPDANVGDIISRQAAIDAVGCYSLHNGDKLLFADKPLKELPSTQPQRMRGRWIEEEDYNGDTIYKCSECGNEFVLIDGTPKDNNYFFCPACGADMREGQDGTD